MSTYQDRWESDDGSVVLYLGDCLDILPTLDPGSVALFVADPPYGIDYQSAWRTDRTQWKPKIANDESPFIWWLPHATPALRDGGGGSSASVVGTCKRRFG